MPKSNSLMRLLDSLVDLSPAHIIAKKRGWRQNKGTRELQINYDGDNLFLRWHF
jgi:hypothetical protein